MNSEPGTELPRAYYRLPLAGKAALDAFSGRYEVTLEPMLKSIRLLIDNWAKESRDVSREADRSNIASMAYRIARSKSALDAAGKAAVDDLKELPKKIDANRKRVRDTLDRWRDEVRAPLTAWEQAEADRREGHTARVRLIEQAGDPFGLNSAQLRNRLEKIAGIFDWPSKEEFEEEYRIAHSRALERLRTALAAAEAAEAQAAELARVQAALLARDAKEREEREAQRLAERERQENERRQRERQENELAEARRVIADLERKEKEAIEAAGRAVAEAQAVEVRRKREAEEREAAEANERLHMRQLQAAAHIARWQATKVEIAKAIENRLVVDLSALQARKAALAIVDAIEAGTIPHVRIWLEE